MKEFPLLSLLVLAFFTPQTVLARDNVVRRENAVLQWNTAALQAIRNTAFPL
jgi:hypothetical protein